MKKYPDIRHLTSYEAAISILTDKNIISKQKDMNNKWLVDRLVEEKKKFNTNDLVFCTPDWFSDNKHETGHGPVMIYFKEKIYNDFIITFTESDSTIYDNVKVYDNNELSKIYKNINNKTDNKYTEIVNYIMGNYDIKNEAQEYDTSKGKQFIDSLYYKDYSEIQLHTKKISTNYIDKIVLTNNYFYKNDNDNELKQKLIILAKENNITILEKKK